ncbi:hypothetical protein, partial [Burkholderia contaminans]|uniref:hypothetical protein n=1 Tax=Burkholderia contaminans TaxID=488447 RepID=UPI001C2EA2C6
VERDRGRRGGGRCSRGGHGPVHGVAGVGIRLEQRRHGGIGANSALIRRVVLGPAAPTGARLLRRL